MRGSQRRLGEGCGWGDQSWCSLGRSWHRWQILWHGLDHKLFYSPWVDRNCPLPHFPVPVDPTPGMKCGLRLASNTVTLTVRLVQEGSWSMASNPTPAL